MVYRTSLTSEEVVRRLSNIVGPKRSIAVHLFGPRPDKPYEGTVGAHDFSIKRVIHYRNSFLPRIHGVVSQGLKGSEVQVVMRLHPLVTVFMVMWLSFAGLMFSASLSRLNEGPWMQLVPLGLLAFGYLMALGGFKFEARRAIRDLTEAIGCEPDKR